MSKREERHKKYKNLSPNLVQYSLTAPKLVLGEGI